MSWRKTSILAIILIVVGALFWWFEIKKRAESEREQLERARLLPGVESISRFRIETRSDIVELEQDTVSKLWNLVAPASYPSDNEQVQNVLKSAMEIHYTDVIADSGIPDEYGLAPVPWARFTANGKTFLLGEETPTHSGVYAQIAGDPRILLVPTEYRQQFLKTSYDLRDKSILPHIATTDLDSAKIECGASKITLAKKGFRWWLTKPAEIAADNTSVDGALASLLSVRAAEFAGENHSDSTIRMVAAKPIGKISFYAKSGTTAELNVLARFEDDTFPSFVFAWTPDKNPLFEVPDFVYRNIIKGVADFRDRSIAKVQDADKFTISGPDGFIVAGELSGGGWKITVPDSARGDKAQIEQFLRTIGNASIDSFKTDGKFRNSGWEFLFTIADSSIALDIGDTIGNMIQVMRPGEREYFLVRRQNIARWCMADWERFVSRQIVEIETQQIQTMTTDIDDNTYKFERGVPDWEVKMPGRKVEMQTNKLRPAIESIIELEFVVALPDTVRFDESKAIVRSDILTIDGSRHHIAIGKMGADMIAAVPEQHEYFVVPDNAMDIIRNRFAMLQEEE